MTENYEIKPPYLNKKKFIKLTIASIVIYIPFFFYGWMTSRIQYPFLKIRTDIKYLISEPAYGAANTGLLTASFLVFLLVYTGLVFLRNNDIIGKNSLFFSLSLFVGTIVALGYDKTMLTGIIIIHVADLFFCILKPGVFSDGAKPSPIWGNKGSE